MTRWHDNVALWSAVTFVGLVAVLVPFLMVTRSQPLRPRDERSLPTAPLATEGSTASTTRRVEALGVLVFSDSLDLVSSSPGRLVQKACRGCSVRKGAIVGVVEPNDGRKASVAEAESDLLRAQADNARAEIEVRRAATHLSRATRLHDIGLLSDEQLEEAQFAASASKASQEAASSVVSGRTAAVNRQRQIATAATLTAPFDGVVTEWYVPSGQEVLTGTSIARVVGSSSLLARFAVAPDVRAQLPRGSAVEVTVVDSLESLTGRVETINAELDANVGLVILEASISLAPSRSLELAGRRVIVRPAASGT